MRVRTLSDYHRLSSTKPQTKKSRTVTMCVIYLLVGFWLGAACNAKYQTYTAQTFLNYSKTNTQLSPSLQDSVANNQTESINFC